MKGMVHGDGQKLFGNDGERFHWLVMVRKQTICMNTAEVVVAVVVEEFEDALPSLLWLI